MDRLLSDDGFRNATGCVLYGLLSVICLFVGYLLFFALLYVNGELQEPTQQNMIFSLFLGTGMFFGCMAFTYYRDFITPEMLPVKAEELPEHLKPGFHKAKVIRLDDYRNH